MSDSARELGSMAAAAKVGRRLGRAPVLGCWLPIGGVEDSGQIHSRRRRSTGGSFAFVASWERQPPLAGPAVLICVQPVLRMLLG